MLRIVTLGWLTPDTHLQQVQNDDEPSNDEDAEADYLSDDEQLQNEASGPSLLGSLRRGVFPPEVSVLYSLCLIQEGGRNYVAKACMESILYLPQEDNLWITDTSTNGQASKQAAWQVYRESEAGPLGRVAAFAFVADTLVGSGKESQWASLLAPMFEALVLDLETHGLTKALADSSGLDSSLSRLRMRHVLKCIIAWARFQVKKAKAEYIAALKSNSTNETVQAKMSILHVIKLLKRNLHISSSDTIVVETHGTISQDCVEVGLIVAHHDDVVECISPCLLFAPLDYQDFRRSIHYSHEGGHPSSGQGQFGRAQQ
jgi:hypothetical protein